MFYKDYSEAHRSNRMYIDNIEIEKDCHYEDPSTVDCHCAEGCDY